MSVCQNCGTTTPENSTTCPNCAQAQAQTPPVYNAQVQGNAQQDAANNKVMAVFSYIGILFLIPLLAAKDSAFARYHANQGIVLFIFVCAARVATTILGLIPVIGFIASILWWALGVVWLVGAIMGIVNAVQGKMEPLPVIGQFQILK